MITHRECCKSVGLTFTANEISGNVEPATSNPSTSSAEASPAKIFPTPAEGQGWTGSEADCFSKPFAWFANSNPKLLCWKTWQLCFLEGWTEYSGTLAEIGFDAEWHCIPAAAVGAPHIRDRVFVIAYSNTNGQRLEKRQGKNASGTGAIFRAQPERDEWWSVEPNVGRVANGIPKRVDRLRGLGNAVVPQVAEYIGRQIVENF
jgi:DNA (cytosine-5)-methyltransferase 1